MDTPFGLNPDKIKCCLCDNKPTNFKTGSVEVENGKVISIRVFFLCEEHKDDMNFEKNKNLFTILSNQN
jgi:hypothetical protein